MHQCPGKWVAIGRAVVYYARAAHAFSAGIKCRHCSYGMPFAHLFQHLQPKWQGSTKMARKRTKSVNVKMPEKEAKFRKGNQYSDNDMSVRYS